MPSFSFWILCLLKKKELKTRKKTITTAFLLQIYECYSTSLFRSHLQLYFPLMEELLNRGHTGKICRVTKLSFLFSCHVIFCVHKYGLEKVSIVKWYLKIISTRVCKKIILIKANNKKRFCTGCLKMLWDGVN